MSDVDHGIAGAIGAAVVGAGVAIRRLFGGDKPGPTLEQFAALEARVKQTEGTMKDIAESISGLKQEVARLTESNDRRDERLVEMRVAAARMEAIVERMERLAERED